MIEKARIKPKVDEKRMFQIVKAEDRKMVLGNLEKYISTEGMGCVVCPCYSSCSRC